MNKDKLLKIIKLAHKKSGEKEYVLEKDFYIVNILRELAKNNKDIIFKGGTCLSKAYKVIKRFSEDVDITLKKEVSSQSKIREFNKLIEEICYNRLGLKSKRDLQDKFPIRHKGLSNLYFLDYSPLFSSDGDIKEYIELDSSFITKVEEVKKMTITPIIQEILNVKEERELEAFEIYVQPIEMIIADKFFAICKNYRKGNVTRYSRHFYDIYMSWNKVISKDQNNIKKLQQYIKEVAEAEEKRYNGKELTEIKDMEEVLLESIKSEKYKEDYTQDLPHYIYGEIPKFEECCKVIKKIIDIGMFKGIKHYVIGKKILSEEDKKKIFIYECIKNEKKIDVRNLTQEEMKNKYCNKDNSILENNIERLREELQNKGKMYGETKYYITKIKDRDDTYFIVGQNIKRSIVIDIIRKRRENKNENS